MSTAPLPLLADLKPEPPRAAILDLGGVVLDIRLEEIPRRWAKVTGLSSRQIADVLSGDDAHQELERGRMTIRQYHLHLAELIGRPMSFEDFSAGFNGIYRGVVPGMEELLAKLAGRLRLVALTNTNALHARTWQGLYGQLLRHFERVFMSHEMGARKPEPECFRQVLDYLQLQPRQVVFVDDDAANVQAATALGMKGLVAADAALTLQCLCHMCGCA